MSIAQMQGRGFKETFSVATGCSPTNLPCLAGKALGITQTINSSKLNKVNKILEAIRDSPGLNTGVDELASNLEKIGKGITEYGRSGNHMSNNSNQIGGCGSCSNKIGGELFLPGRSIYDQLPNRLRDSKISGAKGPMKPLIRVPKPMELARMSGGELFVKGRGMPKKKMNVSLNDAMKVMKLQRGKGMMEM